MLAVYLGFNVLCSSGNLSVTEVVGAAERLPGLTGNNVLCFSSDIFVEVVVLKKLCAVMLFVFVAMLAAGAAFAFDTKIIDDGTSLKNLPANVRPIGHWGTPNVFKKFGKRSVGVGYTVEDPREYNGVVPAEEARTLVGDIFFNPLNSIGSRVGVADLLNLEYIDAKYLRLAKGSYEGDQAMNLQQAESTAVWRAIPMPTGSLLRICCVDPCGEGVQVSNILNQKWYGLDHSDVVINEWATITEDDKGVITAVKRSGPYTSKWGEYDRTPTEHPGGYNDPDPSADPRYAINNPRYGYAVPRIQARQIAHDYFSKKKGLNPGTNVGTDDDPATIGQETMTSVFVWSADSVYSNDLDAPEFEDINPNTVAVMVRLDNDLYKGMKVSDLNVLKVEENKMGDQVELERVYAETSIGRNTFAVVKRTITKCNTCESTFTYTDEVLPADAIIEAGNRHASEEDCTDPCCGDKCDEEWAKMQYFVLIAVEKESSADVADASYKHVIGGLNLIVGHRPFTKTPNIRCGTGDGVARFGWVEGNRPNAEERYDGFTRDPFLKDNISGRAANFGDTKAGYTDAVKAAMGYPDTPWNAMYFVKKEVVDTAYKDSIVYKLPAVRTPVGLGGTAVVMYTIRIGDTEMELLPGNIVGKTLAEANIQAIDVRGVNAEDLVAFERITDCRDMSDGKFVILKKDAIDPLMQDVMREDDTFEANGIYFVALGVKDGGEFDQDKSTVINGQSWVSPVFLVIGGVPVNVLSVTPSTATVLVGETQQFEAKVTTGDVPAVTWSSSDEAVATIDPATGLATAVAVGTATITATPAEDSGFVAATATMTVTVPAPVPSGGSGGGCSVGGFGPASLFLLAPLFLLLKK